MDKIKRTDIKRNTLAREIIRIDFYTVESFEEILENLEKYFKSKDYTFNQYNNYNINYELNDPEPLLTGSFMLKKNVEVIQNYEFVNKNNNKIVFNQNMLIFDKNDFNNYGGIEEYFELIIGALNVIKDITSIKLSRIGIRKINELILNDKKYIEKYFNNKYLADLSKITSDTKEVVYEYSFRPLYNDKDISLNKNIRILKGVYQTEDNDSSDAYSFVWDIDCYKRIYGEIDVSCIFDLCDSINSKIFEEYCDIISNDLYSLIIKKDGNEGILGGLKNGSN